ncbi:MAG TPA: helix-turn-helix domain-containing protein [Solirubrobacteraceae bacterium]|nr:helix-turn-helix domain-containing protein [Solirubrobacteraceae bacterium]
MLLARGLSVEQIAERFDRDPSTVSYWMKKYGLEAPNRDRYAAKGGIEREVLAALVADGKSIAEIAEAVDLSKSTVRHWVGKYGLRTLNRRGPRPQLAAIDARQSGLASVGLTCAVHGETEFVIDARGCYRCRRCRVEAVTRRRRRVKATLVEEAGGACLVCGYDRCQAALAFHHLDPLQKRMMVSAQGMGISIARLREEADKCVLLCHNCHAEVESGVIELPVNEARALPIK